MSALPSPYLLFLGDTQHETWAKTAFGLRDWSGDRCVGQWRLPACRVDVGLSELRPAAAAAAGAKAMIIAVANIGGRIPPTWTSSLVEALDAGLDLIAGLHVRLGSIPEVAEAAQRNGRSLHDVRFTDRDIPIGTGARRSGRRVLTVGTDCSLGKKYTALALTQAMRARGMDADFRATGQTGIMISGDGIAIDAVVADFIAGAAELLSPAASDTHWDVIEGQGAILHPAYAGVTLGLLHGSQPDAMILCHDPSRTHINGFPAHPLSPLPDTIALYERLARVTNRDARVVGVSLNTSKLDPAARERVFDAIGRETGLPVGDPMTTGLDAVVDALAAFDAPPELAPTGA